MVLIIKIVLFLIFCFFTFFERVQQKNSSSKSDEALKLYRVQQSNNITYAILLLAAMFLIKDQMILIFIYIFLYYDVQARNRLLYDVQHLNFLSKKLQEKEITETNEYQKEVSPL